MFKERLKKLRISKELTQKQLADILHMQNTAISKYELGERKPDQEILMQLANFFDVSVDFLLGNSDIRNPYKDDSKSKEEYIFPEEFTNPGEARAYVNKHQIFGSGGFDSDKLDDDEILEFANALLEQMKMVSFKFKK